MSFTVIIPARMASSRLPNKPLADLGGKPMIVRVAERSTASGAQQVWVACDHVDILAACKQHNVQALMTSKNHTCGSDRIAEAAVQLNLPNDAIVVNVQCDEPLIDPEIINATAARVNNTTPIATTAHTIDSLDDIFNPNVVKVVINHVGCALYFSRAAIPWYRDAFQEKPIRLDPTTILRHVGLYAYTHAFLRTYTELSPCPLESIEMLEQLRVLWHGYQIAVYVCKQAPVPGVDTHEDLIRMRRYF